MLTMLLTHAGRVLTHRQLLNEVWEPSHVDRIHCLRVFMTGLRRKLEAEPARPKHLLTVSGVGVDQAPIALISAKYRCRKQITLMAGSQPSISFAIRLKPPAGISRWS